MATPLATSKGAVMSIDEILPLIGEFGKYQIMVEIMFCVTIIPQTLQVLIVYFAALDPGWQCVANSTVCRLNGTITSSQDALYQTRCHMAREEWIYAAPEDYSIVTQFDLYCKDQWLTQLATSVLFIGWGIGAVILGWLADKYGRRMVLFPSMFCILAFGFLGTWAPSITLFIISRVAVGFFIPGTAVQMFIMSSELVGPRKRPFAGIILWLFFTIGLVLLGIKAYFIRKWKTLFIVCTAPYFFVMLFAKFIPESIRWQYVQGKIDGLMTTLKRIAEVNGKEFPDVTLAPLEQPSKSSKRSGSPLDLFRGRKIMISTLSQGFGWFVNGMVYYGVALAADKLGGNLYRDYILASLVEFPAIIMAIDFCNRFGRKKTVAVPMFVGAIACVLVSVIPEGTSVTHWNALRVTLGMLGKFCITLSFDSIYTWSVELNPTSVRAAAMGFLQVTSRAGAASAPWVVRSLSSVSIILPFALMGGATFASACLLLFLSETRDMKTRETLSDEEEDHVSDERDSLKEADKTQLIYPIDKEKNGNEATVV